MGDKTDIDPNQPIAAAGDARANSGPPSRRSRRLPIPGILVAVDAPDVAPHPWVVDAIDINAHGIGLVLPPELPEGTNVLLSFRLADDIELGQVTGSVRHKDGTSGGVLFGEWTLQDRLSLLEFLVDAYERE